MTAKERVQAMFDGKIPDRVPVCLHNFLPAAREAEIPLAVYREDPEAEVRAHVQALETYGHDCILIDLDTGLVLDDLADLPTCGFELDYKTDLEKAKNTVGQNAFTMKRCLKRISLLTIKLSV